VIEDQTNVLVLCVTGYQVPPESPLQAAAVAAVKPTAPQTWTEGARASTVLTRANHCSMLAATTEVS